MRQPANPVQESLQAFYLTVNRPPLVAGLEGQAGVLRSDFGPKADAK
jgi:hypothetical protein